MTEQTENIEVYVGSYGYEVIPREDTERLIAEADAEEVVRAAAKAADSKFDGIGVLDLRTGEIVSDFEEANTTPINPATVKIPLYRVRAADWEEYEPPEVVNWILADEEEEAVLSHANERAAAENYEPWETVEDVPEEYLDSYLRTVGSSYEERRVDCYVFEKEDSYDPEAHEVAYAGHILDLVYGRDEVGAD